MPRTFSSPAASDPSLGALLSGSERARAAWGLIPSGVFVRLDNTNTFRRDHALVTMKIRDLIVDTDPTETEIGPLSMCRLSLIACNGVPCAYVLTAGKCRMRERSTYCTFSAFGEHARNASALFTDGTLGVVGDEHAVVAFLHSRRWIA